MYASPVNWLHSFGFLLLTVAVMRPRLSPAWFIPLPLILASGTGNGEPWQTALALGLGLATLLAALVVRPKRAGARRGRTADESLRPTAAT